MARYIDADELKKCSFVIAYKDERNMTQYGEFVEVVRCKECRFYNEGEMMCNDTNGFGRWWKPDDFCSYGERRTDDANKTN